MANWFKDNDDLRFYFEKGIDWAPVVEMTEGLSSSEGAFKTKEEAVQFYREVVEMVGEFVAEKVNPHVAAIDREGVSLKDGEAVVPAALQGIFDQIKDLGLHGLCLPRDLGGLNCPLVLYFLTAEIFARADTSIMAHQSFHGGIAMAMLVYSIHEGTTTFDAAASRLGSTRFEKEIREIATGEAWGCMDITEPGAGSDMGALRTTAEQDASGQWYVTGQKIFITSGHGKYHFVIARTEPVKSKDDPFAGLSGLSMFLVPAYEDLPDGTRKRFVTMDRVEEKLGNHGGVTAALSFERAPAQLVGKRGEGFKYMLILMNNARLGVGFESIGLCESAYRASLAYADERKSMGKNIARHEMIADLLDEMGNDIQALRALSVAGAVHEELSQKAAIVLKAVEAGRTGVDRAKLERDLAYHKARARSLTPLIKYLASEKSVEMARRCIQIHGGNGYTKDYPGERLLRDSIVLPIYEGTSQIQSLMAMKDTLFGIMKAPLKFVSRLAQARWRAMSAKDPLERRVARLEAQCLATQQILITRTAAGKLRATTEMPLTVWAQKLTKDWDPKKDFAFAMLHAERLTRMLADVAVCDVLLEQARRFPERRAVLEKYLERAEPRGRYLHDTIASTGGRLLEELKQSDKQTAMAAE